MKFDSLRSFSLLLIVICSDQLTKLLARRTALALGDISFGGGFIQFTYVENNGGFLGILSNLPESIRFFLLNICVTCLLLTCLFYLFFYKNRSPALSVPLACIAGGGFSNLLDRIVNNGGVTDFLSIGFGSFRTGILNLADVYILVGSFMLGFSLFYPLSPPNLEK